MRKFVRGVATLAGLALVAPAAVIQAQAKPVIAVLYFDNNSIGKDAADYNGVGKGIADMLITDMASNASVRVVERERIQSLVTEQNLTKAATIDPQTAIKLGKIVGAQYMITGGFMSDGKGTYVLTARAINVETSAITNPVKLTDKGQDVLGLISQLSTKLNSEMKLPALRVGEGPGNSGATPASDNKAAPAMTKSASTSATPAKENKPVAATQASGKKMDMRTAMLYSKALEEEDAGNKTKAVELYRQVVSKFPDYAPAKQKISKLGG